MGLETSLYTRPSCQLVASFHGQPRTECVLPIFERFESLLPHEHGSDSHESRSGNAWKRLLPVIWIQSRQGRAWPFPRVLARWCDARTPGCGSPQPPHQNVEVSDRPMPVSSGIGRRASHRPSRPTRASLPRNVTSRTTIDGCSVMLAVSSHGANLTAHPFHPRLRKIRAAR